MQELLWNLRLYIWETVLRFAQLVGFLSTCCAGRSPVCPEVFTPYESTMWRNLWYRTGPLALTGLQMAKSASKLYMWMHGVDECKMSQDSNLNRKDLVTAALTPFFKNTVVSDHLKSYKFEIFFLLLTSHKRPLAWQIIEQKWDNKVL